MNSLTNAYSLSPPFKSQKPTSPNKQILDNTPGPGAYGIPPIDYQKTEKYHVKREKASSIKKEFQWILSSTRSKSFFITEKNRQLGPGSYNVEDKKPNHQIWNKCTRFQRENANLSLPGPGFYNPKETSTEGATKFGAQSVFKSKTPKAIFKDVQSPNKDSLNEGRLYSPIQQHIEIETKTPKKAERSSFFASKVPRFLTESSNFSEVGPGSYELTSEEYKKQDFPKLIRYSYQSKNNVSKQKERVNSEVGPGSYNIKKFDLSYDLDWKGNSFCRQTRFNFKHKKRLPSSEVPGPGQYMKQQFTLLDGNNFQNKLSFKRTKGFPLKHMKQLVLNEELKDKLMENYNGPGEYALDQFNIDYKLKKKMEHKEKLKIMEISMAGFNSKVPRFH